MSPEERKPNPTDFSAVLERKKIIQKNEQVNINIKNIKESKILNHMCT